MLSINAFSTNNPLNSPEQHFIDSVASDYHCSTNMVKNILKQAQFRADILDRIKKPYEAQPWYIYRNHLITEKRIHQGVVFWQRNKDILQFMKHQFNVPSKIIIGILGIETTYGQQQGKYKVLDSLATLSFHYPARTKFFRAQLADFIVYCLKNHIKANSVLGSYAGAIGQAQFMPTSIKLYAVHAKKKGYLDLSHNEGDVIASISNFLAKHGWHKDQPIIIRARYATHASVKKIYKQHHKRYLSLSAWKKIGITPAVKVTAKASRSYPLVARLVTMKLKHGYEYWLAFHNFNVIKSYNDSDNYALAVDTLGSLVKVHYDIRKQHEHH